MKNYSEILLSIVIPCYEMHGYGAGFLNHSFEIINKQTHKNIEIILPDQSKDDSILNVYNQWKDKLNIKYIDNKKAVKKFSSSNLNFSLPHISPDSKYVKFLFQDDFLNDNTSIYETINEFESFPDSKWLASACCHSRTGYDKFNNMIPYYYDKIYLAEPNSISAPSVLTIRNGYVIPFDENLMWLMDVDYYKQLHILYGDPVILNKITCVNRVWEKQVGQTLSENIKNYEYNYVKEKFEKKI